MEGCEEGGAGKEKERKLWTGFHLGSAISITRLPEQGPLRLPRIASQASSSSNAPAQAGRGLTAEGRPLQGRLLREGAEKVKRNKEQTGSLGPSFPTCSHRPALDVPAGVRGLGWSFLPCSSKALPRELRHPLSFQEGSAPPPNPEDCRQGMQGSRRFLYSPTGLNSASRHTLSPAQLRAQDWAHGSCCKNLC